MKVKVTVEQDRCDLCEQDASYSGSCLGCDKTFCYEHKKTHAVEYAHGCHVGGSGDGTYCLECDQRLSKTNDPLHTAYTAVRALRDEERGFYDRWNKRRVAAEAHLKTLQTSKAT